MMEALQMVLGILLIILKVVGILLLVVLCLLILLLVVPILWRVKICRDKDQPFKEASAKVIIKIWGGFISATAGYDRDIQVAIRLLGIRVWRLKTEEADDEEIESSTVEAQAVAEPSVATESKPPEPKTFEQEIKVPQQAEQPMISKLPEPESNQSQSSKKPHVSWFAKLKQKGKDLIQKVRNIYEQIMEKTALGEAYLNWIESRPVQNSIRYLLMILTKVLRHIRPRSGRGDLSFGTGDPYQTAFLYGVSAEWWTGRRVYVDACPLLEERDIFGHLKIKGHMIPIYLGWQALKVLFNKEIRRSLATRPRGSRQSNESVTE